ncbi:MAG: T9SS type A sorting domain-containing protein [Muribaculum sp.]|nr:T9SS type A sorting domain-containing protein [Muribaculum sp.]
MDEDLEWVYCNTSDSPKSGLLTYQRFIGKKNFGEGADKEYHCLYSFDRADADASEGMLVGLLRADHDRVFSLPLDYDLPAGLWSKNGSDINPFLRLGTNEYPVMSFNVQPGEEFFYKDVASGRYEPTKVENIIMPDKKNDSRYRVVLSNGMVWIAGVGPVGEGSNFLGGPSVTARGLDTDALKLIMLRKRSDGTLLYVNNKLYDDYAEHLTSGVGEVAEDRLDVEVDQLTVSSRCDWTVNVYTLGGAKIKTLHGNSSEAITLSDLEKGVYIISGNIGGKIISAKITR